MPTEQLTTEARSTRSSRPAKEAERVVLRCRFRSAPTAVMWARHAVVDALEVMGLEPWPASLLVSELAANAVDHCRTEFEVRVVLTDRVRVEVSDGGPGLPRLQDLEPGRERGRGLHLVNSVARAWGVEPRRRGKTVWFELDTEPAR